VARKSEPNHSSQTQLRLSETDIENPRSRRTVLVSADYQDERDWVRGAGRCRELGLFEIDHVGHGEMVAPYQVVRAHQSGAFFMACLSGQGQVFVDGRWRTLTAGQACLLPAGLRNSFRIGQGRRWDFCWVRFSPGVRSRTIFRANSPVLADFAGEPLLAAIRGLIAEQKADGLSRRQNQWVELIYDYVRGFAGGFRGDSRIESLWEKVQGRLGDPWDSQALARESGLSFEHLRRLCLREIGRTPMNHLTHLRIQQAVRLISETDAKLSVIAQQVGFANGNSFSSAFKKSTGFAPSHFRTTPAPTE
jgi:AraC-like DNA-binding protein